MAVSSPPPHTATRMLREYDVDVVHRSVRVRLSGALTSDALRSTFIDAEDDPRITPEFVVLIDLRDLTSADRLSAGDIRILAESRLGAVARRAFVARNREEGFRAALDGPREVDAG